MAVTIYSLLLFLLPINLSADPSVKTEHQPSNKDSHEGPSKNISRVVYAQIYTAVGNDGSPGKDGNWKQPISEEQMEECRQGKTVGSVVGNKTV